jgi:hypothetical protein
MSLFNGEQDDHAYCGAILLAEMLSTVRAWREANTKK